MWYITMHWQFSCIDDSFIIFVILVVLELPLTYLNNKLINVLSQSMSEVSAKCMQSKRRELTSGYCNQRLCC